MDIDFKEITLTNWDGIKLKADVDENPDNIIAAVLYSDHGDSFLAIKTKEGIFEYGWWLNRPGYDYDLLEENAWRNRDEFIKLPKLYGKLDKDSYVSNRIYSLIMTGENLKKLEDIKAVLRIGAIYGTAGKQKGDQFIDGDYLNWIWYRGKQVTKKYHKHGIKVKGYTEYDEFGDYNRFYVDMNQFKEADC